MIPDWETNHLFLSDRLEAEHPAIVASLRSSLAGVPIDIISGTADIWCRDYMPVQVAEGRFCKFVYAPDYLRGFEHLITPTESCRLPFIQDYREEPIVVDGGNVVASRNRVILTDKVYKENPSIERSRLRQRLEAVFQAECIFIPQEPREVTGHADGIVRFVSENRVLMNDYSTADPGYGRRLKSVLSKSGLEVETLPMFLDEEGGDFQSAVGLYVNFLRAGDVVVVPAYDRPEDQAAFEKIRSVIPKAKIIQLSCRGLAKKGGALNCVSWTIGKKKLDAM